MWFIFWYELEGIQGLSYAIFLFQPTKTHRTVKTFVSITIKWEKFKFCSFLYFPLNIATIFDYQYRYHWNSCYRCCYQFHLSKLRKFRVNWFLVPHTHTRARSYNSSNKNNFINYMARADTCEPCLSENSIIYLNCTLIKIRLWGYIFRIEFEGVYFWNVNENWAKTIMGMFSDGRIWSNAWTDYIQMPVAFELDGSRLFDAILLISHSFNWHFSANNYNFIVVYTPYVCLPCDDHSPRSRRTNNNNNNKSAIKQRQDHKFALWAIKQIRRWAYTACSYICDLKWFRSSLVQYSHSTSNIIW